MTIFLVMDIPIESKGILLKFYCDVEMLYSIIPLLSLVSQPAYLFLFKTQYKRPSDIRFYFTLMGQKKIA